MYLFLNRAMRATCSPISSSSSWST